MSRKLKPVGPKLGVIDGAPSIGSNVNPYLPGTGWVVAFQPADFTLPQSEIEIYHISLDGPVGSSGLVKIGGLEWDYFLVGWSNSWDPAQVMPLRSGQHLYFCWNFAFTSPPYDRSANVQPRVTVWPQRLSEIQ